MKKFLSIIISLLIMSCSCLSCFAFPTLDGSIRSDEIESSKVQILANDHDSGNNTGNIISYYNNYPSDSAFYLALNMDTGYKELSEKFRIIISIDSKPKIEINNEGIAIFDSAYFDVKTKIKTYGSTMRCENKIIYKFGISNAPEIMLRILDNESIPSKIFKIDTYLPLPNLETNTSLEGLQDDKITEKADVKDDKNEKTTSKKDKKKKVKTTNTNNKNSYDKIKKNNQATTYQSDYENPENSTNNNDSKSNEFENPNKKVIHIGDNVDYVNEEITRHLALGISSGIIVAIVITTMILNIKKANAKEIEKARKEREEKLNKSRGKSNYKK